MARVGFKKTFSSLNKGNLGQVVDLVRTYAVQAGFSVHVDTASLFQFWIETGAYECEEDRPRWSFELYNSSYYGPFWRATPCRNDWAPLNDRDAGFVMSDYEALPTGAVTVHGVFDGAMGCWWLLFESPGTDFIELWAGIRQLRHSSDLIQGVSARFGITAFRYTDYFNLFWPFMRPPRAIFDPGEELIDEQGRIFSALGTDFIYMQKRRAGFPPMIAPCFADSSYAPMVCGELLDIKHATDGYADRSSPLPGWMFVVINKSSGTGVLLRAPESFDAL